MRPRDETRNDVGARIPLARTPLPPTAPRTRRKTDPGIKMSRADNTGWTLDNSASTLSRRAYLSSESGAYREYPIMFSQIPTAFIFIAQYVVFACKVAGIHLCCEHNSAHKTRLEREKLQAADIKPSGSGRGRYAHFYVVIIIPFWI